jgi:hypothetical protein
MFSPSERRVPTGDWADLGVVFRVRGQRHWMASNGYVPTALALSDRIRVFAAFWDRDQVGRIGFVDVDRDDPARVICHSPDPVLDLGAPGAFDEHGTTPMSVIADGDVLRLYYAGWQRVTSVRYLLFTGLAISRDGGLNFERVSDVPVLDRVAGHHLVRTGYIAHDGAVWKAWIAQSNRLIDVDGKPTPSYGLDYLESLDGISWPGTAHVCFRPGHDGVFGYGRSAVWRDGDRYHAMLSVRRRDGYRIEYACSPDGIAWSKHGTGGFALPPARTRDAQAETMFPSVVRVDREIYAFYNGDGFGRDGVRCAQWIAHT